MLEQIDESLWLIEGGLVNFYGFPYPTRSVIARLASGELWVWSPVHLTAALREEVDALGAVRHLVSPNKIHHLFLKDWHVAYPEAQLWGPASTVRKRSDLVFREPLEDRPPAEWIWDIDQAWFQGSLFLDEIVFLHKPSRTVIVGDLIEAFGDEFLHKHWGRWKSFVARLDGITLAKPGAPRELRWSFVKRAVARAARDKVLDWNCERVVMAHGEWQRTDGHAFLERALAWLGK